MVPVVEAAYVDAAGVMWFRCRNFFMSDCNWLVAAPGDQCFSCGLTRTRPPDADLEGLALFTVAEGAKRHLIAELDRIGLRIVTRAEDPDEGLCFDLLSSVNEKITMGHNRGAITIDLQEGDDVIRVKMAREFREPYRTMLGHFRHEIGHYYELKLVLDDPRLTEAARTLFGDERADYQTALDRHYRDGPPAGWESSYISSYATMHPFEDFAESFAHFLHIRDVIDTAHAFGLIAVDDDTDLAFGDLVRQVWIPLSTALNQVNRSMGRRPLYPFRLADPVIEKLEFVARLVGAGTMTL